MDDVMEILISDQPDILATSCPLCKKTFSKSHKIPVKDIAEIILDSLYKPEEAHAKKQEMLNEKKDLKENWVCQLEEKTF
jgi:hypothetical protein